MRRSSKKALTAEDAEDAEERTQYKEH